MKLILLYTLYLALLARPQREKIKKKVAEAKRKSKRDAKKDVTWKNHSKFLHLAVCGEGFDRCLLLAVFVHAADKEKDLGIPSKFPFKDQILADAAELKVKVGWQQ